MSYTDVFGTDTLPPAEFGYSALIINTDTTLVWPYNSNGGDAVSKIMSVTANVAALSLIFPDATEVSVGEDFLIRNVGAETFTLKDSTGGVVATLAPSAAKYFYLTSNATAAGSWGVLTYGSGASAVDAAALVGYGVKAINASLNQAHPVFDSGSVLTIDATYRAKVFNYTGGADTLPLTSATTLGDDFFFLLRNSGAGTLTIDPASGELIDGVSTIQLQPGESALLVCSGAAWFTVGQGRSIQYNFTQLVYDVTAGTPFTLTPAEASNKLLRFIGSPGAGVTVNVPATVAVYYIYNDLSTAYSVTVKTASGAGAVIAQGQRVIAMCDGTDVVSAQSAAVSTDVALTDGSQVAPSLNFASQTNTGIFKYGATGVGIAVDGAAAAYFGSTGATIVNGVSGGTF